MVVTARFTQSGGNGGGGLFKVTGHSPFFQKNLFFVVLSKDKHDEGLDGNGKARTHGTDPNSCVLSREDDVREEVREEGRCFFNDLW